jgi:hypothetical protein
MEKRVLIYTFFGFRKNCSKLLYNFEHEECEKLFIPNRFSTKKLIEQVSEYQFIIGIADLAKNVRKSRFDPKYINKYGTRKISNSNVEFHHSNINPELNENEWYRFATYSNGPCNRSAFLIMEKILQEKLSTKFGFFHLCKNFTSENLLELITTITRQEIGELPS